MVGTLGYTRVLEEQQPYALIARLRDTKKIGVGFEGLVIAFNGHIVDNAPRFCYVPQVQIDQTFKEGAGDGATLPNMIMYKLLKPIPKNAEACNWNYYARLVVLRNTAILTITDFEPVPFAVPLTQTIPTTDELATATAAGNGPTRIQTLDREIANRFVR